MERVKGSGGVGGSGFDAGDGLFGFGWVAGCDVDFGVAVVEDVG